MTRTRADGQINVHFFQKPSFVRFFLFLCFVCHMEGSLRVVKVYSWCSVLLFFRVIKKYWYNSFFFFFFFFFFSFVWQLSTSQVRVSHVRLQFFEQMFGLDFGHQQVQARFAFPTRDCKLGSSGVEFLDVFVSE